ncbi:MAG TPA: alpha/beta fold hydrolase [Burkholderiales bacterium]|nr:alpha/beta fold hydrolase [Burkholderiales bacterium]
MIWNILITVSAAYFALCLLLFFFQSRFIYYPEIGREVVATPRDAGLDYQQVTISSSGEKLDAWFVPAPQARGVVLFLHGNGGSISLRLDYLRMFGEMGLSVFIFDYRGFGKSSGKPTEAGTYQDAEAAWKYLVQTRHVPPTSIVLYGESLGGAVAAWLAAHVTPGALIIASTFTSVPDLAAKYYYMFPVRLLVRYQYNTEKYLQSVSCPVLVVHSPEDEVVPFEHGQLLYAVAHEPKQLLQIHGGHNNGLELSHDLWMKGVGAFLDRYLGASHPTQHLGSVKESRS